MPEPAPYARARRGGALLLLIGGLILVFLVHVGWGNDLISPIAVVRELLAGPDNGSKLVWPIRLPRACGAALAGALLATVGSAFQALFRNPLADPYVMGVSSGAALGGVAAILLGFSTALSGLAMPLAGVVGGFLSLVLVIALARKQGAVDPTTLILAGVVIGSMLSALLSLGLVAAGQDTNQILRWLLGSTSPMFWNRVALMAAVLLVGLILLDRQSRAMNVLALGEDAARRMGVDADRLKTLILIVGATMTAVAVGSVGIIGFVGLVAPHIARQWIGVDWRWSLPASTLVGAGLLLASDVVAQRLLEGRSIELPVGVVTAILGAPVLLVLLRRAR